MKYYLFDLVRSDYVTGQTAEQRSNFFPVSEAKKKVKLLVLILMLTAILHR